jgi:molecular chaperone GrpE
MRKKQLQQQGKTPAINKYQTSTFVPLPPSKVQEKYAKSELDYKNLQEQSKREIQAAKSFAIQRFARDLLETVDNMARASSIIAEEIKQDAERHKPFADLLDGLNKAEGKLLGTLKSHGMTMVDPTGDKFDPNIHEATFEMAFPGEPGTVFHVEQKGYLLNGRVLRPAKVVPLE